MNIEVMAYALELMASALRDGTNELKATENKIGGTTPPPKFQVVQEELPLEAPAAKSEPSPEPVADLTLTEKVLAAVKKVGKPTVVQALQSFGGATRLSDVPADQHKALEIIIDNLLGGK